MRAVALILIGLGVLGCESQQPPLPIVSAMDPSSVFPDVSTSARVLGANFVNEITISIDQSKPPTYDDHWEVSIDDIMLEDVTWRNEATLDVTIPAGLALDTYDVTVTSPAGHVVTIVDGLTVSDVPIIDPPQECEDGEEMYVTTNVDEDDPGETRNPPHQGAGLSLREAIGISNASVGRDCLIFPSAISVQPSLPLPAFTDDDGLVVVGDGSILDGSLLGEPALTLSSANNLVTGLVVFGGGIAVGSTSNTVDGNMIHGAGECVSVSGNSNMISRNVISDCMVGVIVDGDSNTVAQNRIHDHTSALVLNGGATSFFLNEVYDNSTRGMRVFGSDAVIRHNVFHANGRAIQRGGQPSGMIVENNIFIANSQAAVDVFAGNISTLNYNLYFANSANCSSCTIGAMAITEDPLLADPVSGNFSLEVGSPAIDAGVETGIDVNGEDFGDYNGSAPDIGANESK